MFRRNCTLAKDTVVIDWTRAREAGENCVIIFAQIWEKLAIQELVIVELVLKGASFAIPVCGCKTHAMATGENEIRVVQRTTPRTGLPFIVLVILLPPASRGVRGTGRNWRNLVITTIDLGGLLEQGTLPYLSGDLGSRSPRFPKSPLGATT